MITDMAPMYVTLTFAYVEENLHGTEGKSTKQSAILDHKNNTWMTVSYLGNCDGEELTSYITYFKPTP